MPDLKAQILKSELQPHVFKRFEGLKTLKLLIDGRWQLTFLLTNLAKLVRQWRRWGQICLSSAAQMLRTLARRWR